MKGLIFFFVMAGILWGFWMSYEWLRNRNNNNTKSKKK